MAALGAAAVQGAVAWTNPGAAQGGWQAAAVGGAAALDTANTARRAPLGDTGGVPSSSPAPNSAAFLH